MNKPVQILYLEDNPRDAELVRDKLQQATSMACTLTVARDRAEYEAALAQTRFDLILSDYRLPNYDGMAALALARVKQPDVPFILISGTLGEEQAVDCVLRGATDYLLKQRLERLVPAVVRALTEAEERRKRREAEAAARANEQKYRRLFESTRDAIMTLEPPSWRFTSGNPAAVEMFGAKNEVEFVSHGSWELAPEQQPDGCASAEKAKEMIEKAVREGSCFFEWMHRRVGGEEFPANVLLTRMEQGGKVILQATVRDITERKRAEAAQRVLSARHEAILAAVPDIIMEVDTHKIYTWANPAGLAFFGHDVVGKEAAFYFSGEQSTYASVQPLFEGGQDVIYVESWQLRLDGAKRLLAWWCRVLKDGSGNVTGALASARDITERKRADARIREQAALLDTANDAIYVTALDCTILYWNRGAERTYGWTSAEVLNRKTTELISPGQAATEALIPVLLKQESWSGERQQITKSGGMVEVFSRLTLVRNERGQPQSVFAINTDITEKKQLEIQFLRAQRLENIGALASGIAHDLNNVLAPILMGAPLLQEMVKDEKVRHLLKTMEASAQRGAAIVKQVLTFARGVEGERVPLQPRHLQAEMEGLAAETFPKNIRVESGAAADLWPVLGDATQLHQVLLNLCINARDAMPGGGVLTLQAANVVLSREAAEKIPGARPGSFACLRVTDTGTGIPPEIAAKIFEPFFTTKGVGKGTGLGLSTVLGIVRSHGGFIRVASKVGQGTTFELYLPATKGEPVAVKKDSATPLPHARGEGILLVDDEAAVREVARQALMEFGYRVITAGRGVEALRIFQERRQEIQLVLTDMLMPGMDGPTLIGALRVLDPAVKIVGITGMGDTTGMSGLKMLALSAVLTKPFTIKQLLAVIREALPATAGHERAV